MNAEFMLTSDDVEIIKQLVERWKVELQDNLDHLEINMPKELQEMMEQEIRKAMVRAEEILDELRYYE